jgi:rubrerythrin
MLSQTQDALATEIARGGRAYVRNLALAEAAVVRGQFNLAKVLRALAHTQRMQALAAARLLAPGIDPTEVLGTIVAELALALPDASVAGAMAVRERANEIARRAEASLAGHRDVTEMDIAQFLWGCYGCGYLAEGELPDVCPICGALAVEFEEFGPFYSWTPEHLGQLRPAEILDILRAGPDTVAAAFAGLDEARLGAKPSPQEWCLKEIAGHVLETERLFVRRAQAVLADEGMPTLDTPVPPWQLHEGLGYEALSGSELLGRLREARATTLTLVGGLRSEDWVRMGSIGGSAVTLLDLGTWLANHDRGHLAQMQRLAGH